MSVTPAAIHICVFAGGEIGAIMSAGHPSTVRNVPASTAPVIRNWPHPQHQLDRAARRTSLLRLIERLRQPFLLALIRYRNRATTASRFHPQQTSKRPSRLKDRRPLKHLVGVDAVRTRNRRDRGPIPQRLLSTMRRFSSTPTKRMYPPPSCPVHPHSSTTQDNACVIRIECKQKQSEV